MQNAFPAQTEEWFADTPKQWLNNAYQNKAAGRPQFIYRPNPFGFVCTLAPMGLPIVSATGRNRKDAETRCALQAVSKEV